MATDHVSENQRYDSITGTDDSINGVYGLIRDLLVEGKDARFVNRRGRYVLNWSRALDCYADYKARKNPHFKSKNLTRRKASNGLRSALLNFYKNEGAKEYKESKKVNDKDEVVERQFQMPPRVFESLFGNTVPSPGESGISEQEDEQEINSITSEVGQCEEQNYDCCLYYFGWSIVTKLSTITG